MLHYFFVSRYFMVKESSELNMLVNRFELSIVNYKLLFINQNRENYISFHRKNILTIIK